MSCFLSPIQGPARLYAYVKKAGFDVQFRSFNQEAYFRLLSGDYLEDALSRLESSTESMVRSQYLRKSIGSLLHNNSNEALGHVLAKLSGKKLDTSNIYYALVGNKDYVLSEIEKSNKVLYKDFLNLPPDVFLQHFQNLHCGKAIIDAAYFPSQIDFSFGFSGLSYGLRASDLVRSVDDERFNFMLPYFRKEVLPLIEQDQPELIGMAITHSSEFVLVFSLSSLIRKHFPDIHICLGGATLSEVAYRIQKNPSLHNFFDSMILGPAEHSFCQLIEHLEHGKNLSTVPDAIYKKNGSLTKSEPHYEFDLNDACCPEYVDFRPGSPLPLETSNTCYWGKCIFCYYPRMGLSDISRQHDRRSRDLELVCKDIEILNEKYDSLFIAFTDSAIPPKRLEHIADYCYSLSKKVKFSAFVRFEKEFRSLSLCRDLAEKGFLGGQAGLESGCQASNDLINKGVNVTDAETILKNFHSSGILIHVYSIVGIPGETEDQASETLKFIERMSPYISLDWQIYCFYLLENSPLAERVKEFDMEPIPLPDDYLTQLMTYNVQQGLTMTDSVKLSIKYQEKIKHLRHPINDTFDIESSKIFLLAQHAKGIDISKIKSLC